MLNYKAFIAFFIVAFVLMSSIISFGATISYTYDDFHRLKQIENHSNGTVTVYYYDEVGNRTRKIVTSPSSPPVAEFSASQRSGPPPLPVNFSDQSVGNITSWSWDFGDGGTSSLQNPSHTYQSLGNYTVSLTVDGPNGSDTSIKASFITVTNPPSCTYWLSQAWQFFEASGGSDYVRVYASSSDCPWTAISNVPWITITSENSGTGNGDVYYSVAPNIDPSQRDGTITIADQTFAITQAAGGCVYSISPISKSFDSTGGTGSVNVTVAIGCEWTATSNDSWITITSGGIGTGNGIVNYFVEETIDMNPRTGTITIAGKTFTVNQNVSEAGSSIQLPKTGQAKCYDSSGTEISCTGTGQDGENQAGVAWPDPRFTIGTGAESECITDNLTGLMWARNGNLNGKRTWYEAINYANNLTLCGYSDWHLPNVNELESLINADEPSTAAWLNIQGFNNIQSNNYWTSTTFFTAPDTSTSWCVHMTGGQMDRGTKSWDYNYVWPVHSLSDSDYPASIWQTGQKTSYAAGDDGDLQIGVAWPSPRFEDNGNGIVTDNLTNLIWLIDANCIKTIYSSFDNDWTSGDGEVSWQHALDFVQGINDGTYSNCGSGYTDWRLPNRKELRSLMDYSNLDPALPSDHPFTNVQSGYYWTSTTGAGSASYAWLVRMLDIIVGSGGKEEGGLFVWPVRSGTEQCQSEPETLATGVTGPVDIAVDDTNVYWTEFYGLKKVSKTGSSVVTLATSSYNSITGLAIDNDYVYFGDNVGNPASLIKKVPKTGGSVITLVSGLPSVCRVSVDSSYVYWTASDGGTVNKMPINGGSVSELADGSNTPCAITVDNSNVYWSEFTNPGSVNKVSKNGDLVTTLASNANSLGIAVDSNYIYWPEYVVPNGKVNRVPINGGSLTTLATGLNKPYDVAIDDAYAYWIENNSNGAVKKVSLAGGTVTILASSLNSPEAIAIDDTHAYWIERGSGTLKRVTKECTPPDTTPPTLSITSHSDGQHVTTSTITLAGTANDSELGDNGIQQVTVNGSRAYNDTATGSVTANWSKAVNLNVGPNTITVIAYDNSVNHNQSTQSITIYYDRPPVSLLTPNGGEVIPSGSTYSIQWQAPPEAAKFDLMYSKNNGLTWLTIANNVTGLSYNWTVPKPLANKRNCLVKVIGYDASSLKIGEDTSDATFTIEVIRLISPNGGGTLTSGSTHTITWLTNATKKAVAKTKLFYTINGGSTWTLIKTLIGNPGSYNWRIPNVSSSSCKVKVVLRNASGTTIGKDLSDNFFTIQP
jgi:PKD repeat protein